MRCTVRRGRPRSGTTSAIVSNVASAAIATVCNIDAATSSATTTTHRTCVLSRANVDCTIGYVCLTQVRPCCINGAMQNAATGAESPELTPGWRMRMALEHAGVSFQEMADELQVSRQTLTRWTHDEIEPKRVYLRAWAEKTGVSFEWLAGEEEITVTSLQLVTSQPGRSSPSPKARPVAATGRKPARREQVTDNKYYRGKRRGVSRGPAVARHHALHRIAVIGNSNRYRRRLNRSFTFCRSKIRQEKSSYHDLTTTLREE